jgi:glyoxylase-like metal-dependent hydrolase (beta-lactamase superfamily II)
MEIAPGIHWFKAGYANVYLCVEDDGLTLVDSGTPRQASKILGAMARIGHVPSDLKQILVTHADWDHAGSAADLQTQTGATVISSPATAAFLRRGRAPKHMPQPIAFLVDLFRRYRPVPQAALLPTPAGTLLPILDGLHVLATPGHTPDHHAFYSPTRGVLFAGDALGTRSGRLGLPPALIAHDYDAALHSVRRLLQLTPAIFACGHGEPLRQHSSDDLMRLQKELDGA